MFAFCAKNRQKEKINENTETQNFSVLCGKLHFPTQIQNFFQNAYSRQIFCKFTFGYTVIIALRKKTENKLKLPSGLI